MIDLLDLHTHTTASGHAYNSLYEMVHSASVKGLSLFGCSDHAPAMPGSCHSFHFINFKVLPRTLYGVRLMMGVELNIMDYDGTVDLEQSVLEPLDYAIASLHQPCIHSGTALQNTSAYLGALKNPLIHIIGHPDDSRFPIDYEVLVKTAKETGTLLEVNNSSLREDNKRENADENIRVMLEYCKKYEVPITTGSDSHLDLDAGKLNLAEQILTECHFPEELIVTTSLEKLKPYVNRYKKN